MSDPVPLTSKLPRERRLLIGLLAGLEGVLLLTAVLLGQVFQPQPNPGGPPCPTPLSQLPPGAQYSCAIYPSNQIASLVATACALAALLVLPVVIGWFSVRWQAALAAPAMPIWVLLLADAVLSLIASGPAFNANGGSGGLRIDLSILLAGALFGALLSLLIVVVGLGGLGWLARRAFAR